METALYGLLDTGLSFVGTFEPIRGVGSVEVSFKSACLYELTLHGVFVTRGEHVSLGPFTPKL